MSGERLVAPPALLPAVGLDRESGAVVNRSDITTSRGLGGIYDWCIKGGSDILINREGVEC